MKGVFLYIYAMLMKMLANKDVCLFAANVPSSLMCNDPLSVCVSVCVSMHVTQAQIIQNFSA